MSLDILGYGCVILKYICYVLSGRMWTCDGCDGCGGCESDIVIYIFPSLLLIGVASISESVGHGAS